MNLHRKPHVLLSLMTTHRGCRSVGDGVAAADDCLGESRGADDAGYHDGVVGIHCAHVLVHHHHIPGGIPEEAGQAVRACGEGGCCSEAHCGSDPVVHDQTTGASGGSVVEDARGSDRAEEDAPHRSSVVVDADRHPDRRHVSPDEEDTALARAEVADGTGGNHPAYRVCGVAETGAL